MNKFGDIDIDDKELDKVEAMICSMTQESLLSHIGWYYRACGLK